MLNNLEYINNYVHLHHVYTRILYNKHNTEFQS